MKIRAGVLALVAAVSIPSGVTWGGEKAFPLAKASAEHKKMFAEVKAAVLTEAREPVGAFKDARESWYWLTSRQMMMLLDAYDYCGDAKLLAEYVRIQKGVLSQRYIHPTQPEWNGWFHYKDGPRCLIDHEAIIYYEPVLRFVKAVRADGALKKKYGKQAGEWLTDVERSMKAWDKRGSWHELGEKGGWYTHPEVLPDAKTGKLIAPPGDVHLGGTIPYNKVHAFVQALVLGWQITGNDWFKTRAEKCCTFFRAHWRVDARHAEWNYRDHEFGGDFASGKLGVGKRKTGVFVHPRASYYMLDVATIVKCYDAGIFYQQADIDLLLRTNLKFMFSGDKAHPKFRKINGAGGKAEKYGWGEGMLWTSLAHFNQDARDLWKADLAQKKKSARWHWPPAALAYLHETARPISWERRDTETTAAETQRSQRKEK